jgi:hypothetical protein
MTVLLALALLGIPLAAWPALLFVRNLLTYLPLPKGGAVPPQGCLPAISVLIPARNEVHTIGEAIEAVVANRGVDYEVVILDDHSTDATAEVVQTFAERHPQVRLAAAPPLPPGWCGKQHACFVLAGLARHPLLLFLDADVRLAPDALARLAAYGQAHPRIPLASGFPRQVTGSLLEDLLIPLMHFILLGFLPLHRMRSSTNPAYAAGCGQLFLARMETYHTIGGHSLVKGSLHDGITLPRAYRGRGCATDLFDATDLAACRMYTSPAAVWRGLAKNATEGLGAPTLILPVTLLLLVGHVVPFALIVMHQFVPLPPVTIIAAAIAASLAWTPRVYAMIRFRQAPLGALLHPVGIVLLLMIQWQAFLRHLQGRPATWKDRAYAPSP